MLSLCSHLWTEPSYTHLPYPPVSDLGQSASLSANPTLVTGYLCVSRSGLTYLVLTVVPWIHHTYCLQFLTYLDAGHHFGKPLAGSCSLAHNSSPACPPAYYGSGSVDQSGWTHYSHPSYRTFTRPTLLPPEQLPSCIPSKPPKPRSFSSLLELHFPVSQLTTLSLCFRTFTHSCYCYSCVSE